MEYILEDVIRYIQIHATKNYVFNELKSHGIALLNKNNLKSRSYIKELELDTRCWHSNGYQWRLLGK